MTLVNFTWSLDVTENLAFWYSFINHITYYMVFSSNNTWYIFFYSMFFRSCNVICNFLFFFTEQLWKICLSLHMDCNLLSIFTECVYFRCRVFTECIIFCCLSLQSDWWFWDVGWLREDSCEWEKPPRARHLHTICYDTCKSYCRLICDMWLEHVPWINPDSEAPIESAHLHTLSTTATDSSLNGVSLCCWQYSSRGWDYKS